ncbi:hypothetical protein EDB92DRAFT_1971992 [Lactarius akahatsu]|uniref:Uncharacterized protein n=1 Tax=Lactarius akahatsu TaxID=416441 RepID=A0AAD4L818_9AGAM|nr:hypothetical protein EDB92DRAFT_1971992 [Lactarius akahatsu]
MGENEKVVFRIFMKTAFKPLQHDLRYLIRYSEQRRGQFPPQSSLMSSYRDQEVENMNRILCEKQEEAHAQGFWPPLPIAIRYDSTDRFTRKDKDNLFAALEHPDRVSRVDLCLKGSHLEEVATVMQVPFLALTHLGLRWEDKPPTVPSGFLGGSAPRLQHLDLEGVFFPSLLTLLSSTGDLIKLSLDDITEDAYISPEAMAACLAALPKLEDLFIGFRLGTSSPDRIRPPPVTRSLVPSPLTFEFYGTSEYLDNLMARLDCPQLEWTSSTLSI